VKPLLRQAPGQVKEHRSDRERATLKRRLGSPLWRCEFNRGRGVSEVPLLDLRDAFGFGQSSSVAHRMPNRCCDLSILCEFRPVLSHGRLSYTCTTVGKAIDQRGVDAFRREERTAKHVFFTGRLVIGLARSTHA
jgi:hypothetical protein